MSQSRVQYKMNRNGLPSLTYAHRGYEYQDLLVAIRLIDVMLGSVITAQVDKKLVPNDRFDDLTTIDNTGLRERVQIKYTDRTNHALPLETFSTDRRKLRLDCLIATALAEKEALESEFREFSFRIILRDTLPTNAALKNVLTPAIPDPGPFTPGMKSIRMRFQEAALLGQATRSATDQPNDSNPFDLVFNASQEVSFTDLEWICNRLVVELDAPVASLDLSNPNEAEHLLLMRVRNEVGAEMYPNSARSAADVAEALISCARAARRGSMSVSAETLLHRTQLRTDFGAVARANPVDKSIEVPRHSVLSSITLTANDAAESGRMVLLVGPPGQGKSWICKQLLESLTESDWLIAEHYCYLGDADGEQQDRVSAESIFGSLLARIAEYDRDLVSGLRPRFAADERALKDAVSGSINQNPERRVVLVVDGIDHITRVKGRGPDIDPSQAFAESLASLELVPGSVLIVLSQPGSHLNPLVEKGAVTVQIPDFSDIELRQLAKRLGVIGKPIAGNCVESESLPIVEENAIDGFLKLLSDRSQGNALYATYLCREVLRSPDTVLSPDTTVENLPYFDGTLQAYYEHLHTALGEHGAWVADVIALLDFPVSRSELKEISPERAHKVDSAVETLGPVLFERATQGGIRVYHESFARFLRLSYEDSEVTKSALLDAIIKWLKKRGIFKDSRAFRYLLSVLSEGGYDQEVVNVVDDDFVVEAIAAGFPVSAIIQNLSKAIHSAAKINCWSAVIRYVEMSRSAETYQEERFETETINSIDVVCSMTGRDSLAERLLHNGRTVMAGRSGMQICKALDEFGAIPPWQEYMIAFLREKSADNVSYGVESNQIVELAYLRGRLRLSALSLGQYECTDHGDSQPTTTQKDSSNLYAPIDWQKLGRRLDNGELNTEYVIESVLDIYGLSTVIELIDKLSNQGKSCLALAEAIEEGRAPSDHGNARFWAERAFQLGLPPGYTSRVFALGAEIGESDIQQLSLLRLKLLELTRKVQDIHAVYKEDSEIPNWIDACLVAAKNDRFALSTAEALIDGTGWYFCWLRFLTALVIAETTPGSQRSQMALSALRILTEERNPFLGDPRACDLYQIHSLILKTIRRAVVLLDDQDWKDGIEILFSVSDSISTTIHGEINGPVPRDRLLHIVVDTTTPSRFVVAQNILDQFIHEAGGKGFYSDLAEYRIIGARLALKSDDPCLARQYWQEACRLLVAYGWRRDITIFELLNPLPALIKIDPAAGRKAVAEVQPLCDRVMNHTDGKDTHHTTRRWWQLLAKADPYEFSELVSKRLLSSCNDPNGILDRSRSDLWRDWYRRTNPFMAGVLRLTLEEPLDDIDIDAFKLLSDMCDGTDSDKSTRLLTLLFARIDERPFKYGVSNQNEILDQDNNKVNQLNSIAKQSGISGIGPLLQLPSSESSSASHESNLSSFSPGTSIQVYNVYQKGSIGLTQAVRDWNNRPYGNNQSDCSLDQLTNVIGFRLIELIDAGRESDVEITLYMIADTVRFEGGPSLLKPLAEGLERFGYYHLAAKAYTLVWTRARGHGGWLTFGGENEIECLQRATKLDRPSTLRTVASEVERAVSRRIGTYGISQALVYGFAIGGLSTSKHDAFSIWHEAFRTIASRLPRMSSFDDPLDVYKPPVEDCGSEILGNIDIAFANAAVAGLAHPSREQKRRTLIGINLLISECATFVTPALNLALSSLSDPATLTWLTRLIETSHDKTDSIVSNLIDSLSGLAVGPHLTVRALARRQVSSKETPLPPLSEPDSELLDKEFTGITVPPGSDVDNENDPKIDKTIDAVAGDRISQAEEALPGLRNAVYKLVSDKLSSDEHKQRLSAQARAFADQIKERWPDAYMAPDEAVEDALQRVAAGVRAARIMNGDPLGDPIELEDSLAQLLLDDPEIPLAVENCRRTRPPIPPPPFRGDDLWQAIDNRANGCGEFETGILAASNSHHLQGTVDILTPAEVPVLADGIHCGWRVAASYERRTIAKDWRDKVEDIAFRYRAIELRPSGDREELTNLPFLNGDIRIWDAPPPPASLGCRELGTQQIVGIDLFLRSVGDSQNCLGIQKGIPVPSAWLYTTLGIRSNQLFTLNDDKGRAVELITWRTEYETSDYHLAWPRCYGAGLVIRGDVFDQLVERSEGELTYRDFVAGSCDLRL